MGSITDSTTGVLSDLEITQVFNKLAITPYLKTQPCSLLDAIFTGHQDGWTKGIITCTVKPVLSGHSKINKTKILMANGSLMKVESIAECSPWSILQYF